MIMIQSGQPFLDTLDNAKGIDQQAEKVAEGIPLSKHSRFAPLQHDFSPKAQRGVFGCPSFRDPTPEPRGPKPRRTSIHSTYPYAG